MSRVVSSNKSYDSSPIHTPYFKEITPNFKEITPADRAKDGTQHVPILMDEYGQTPDHYYLARKPPPSFYQVRRKLDLQSAKIPKDNSKPHKAKIGKKEDHKLVKNTSDRNRYDTSLGQLTKKFLQLLSDASDGVINLNTACGLLSVPKRRLYDITNVLEGAGLISKISRNNIQWRGRVASPCANVVKNLENDIDILEAKENKLDDLIYYMTTELNSLKEADSKYQYVTIDDLKDLEDLSQKLILGVTTSPSTDVEKKENTVVISSKNTEIEAYFLIEDLAFMNILHKKAVLKENSYQVMIKNNSLDQDLPEDDSPSNGDSQIESEYIDGALTYNEICAGTMWTEGDTVIKNAFIAEEDDIAPMGRHFLLQTEDQDLDIYPFSFLDSGLDSYSFSLDEGEGLTDLFDCGFSCP